MTDQGPPEPTLPVLVRLITSGESLTEFTEDQLIAAVRSARQARKDAQGRAAVELHRRGWTWEQIGAALEVSQSTAYRWAEPYM